MEKEGEGILYDYHFAPTQLRSAQLTSLVHGGEGFQSLPGYKWAMGQNPPNRGGPDMAFIDKDYL
jgi:hypothetical protein